MEQINSLTPWQMATFAAIKLWIANLSTPEKLEDYQERTSYCGKRAAILDNRTYFINPGRAAGKTVLCEVMHAIFLKEYGDTFLLKHNRAALRNYIQRYDSRSFATPVTGTPHGFLERVKGSTLELTKAGLSREDIIQFRNCSHPIIILDECGLSMSFTDFLEALPDAWLDKEPVFIVVGSWGRF